MRSQTDRDQQAVTIATSLAIFATIIGAALLLALVLSAGGVELSEGAATAVGWGTLLLAAFASITYLVRHRRA